MKADPDLRMSKETYESVLKPCPFCGGKAHLEGSANIHWVICGNCECETRGARTMPDAVSIWNERYGVK